MVNLSAISCSKYLKSVLISITAGLVPFTSIADTATTTAALSNPQSVEVFHYWTTASEAKSIAVLKSMAEQRSIDWIDAKVEGAAGENAFASLEARVLSARAPDIGQIKGLDIRKWSRLGMLKPLTEINAQPEWQSALPEAFLDHLKQDDVLYAIPMHIHRTNWLWISQSALEKTGLPRPQSWKDLITLAEEMESIGIPVIAQSLDGWQLATLFEGLVLASAGPEFYRKVFINLSYRHARGEDMEHVFSLFRSLQKHFIKERESGYWDQNAISVANGESAIMFMGDWMKGELLNKERFVGKDYICVATPGLYQGFIYDVNSFSLFKNRSNHEQNSKAILADVLSGEFQTNFNVLKGSMPIHRNVNIEAFDDCTKQSIADFDTAVEKNSLVPSVAHGLANINGVQHGLFEALVEFVNDPTLTPKQGAKMLAKKLKYGAYYISNN